HHLHVLLHYRKSEAPTRVLFAVVEELIFVVLPSPGGDSLVVFTNQQGKNKTLLNDLGDVRGLTADSSGLLWWLKCNPLKDKEAFCESVELWSMDPKSSALKPQKMETIEGINELMGFDVNSAGVLPSQDVTPLENVLSLFMASSTM
ncbi:hypothetical protein QOT17_024705, partial [Balamuthia mandrillaris]